MSSQITDRADLEAAIAQPLFLLFKHSRVCPISSRAFAQYEEFTAEEPDLPTAWIDVIAARPLSQRVAAETGIEHRPSQKREIEHCSLQQETAFALETADPSEPSPAVILRESIPNPEHDQGLERETGRSQAGPPGRHTQRPFRRPRRPAGRTRLLDPKDPFPGFPRYRFEPRIIAIHGEEGPSRDFGRGVRERTLHGSHRVFNRRGAAGCR